MVISLSRTGLLAQTFWRSPGSRAHCFLACEGVFDYAEPSGHSRITRLAGVTFPLTEKVDLAEALPGNKLTWRPSPGTRSFAEVFLHVAGERYGILSMMGAKPPAGFKAREFEKSTTEKDRIVHELNQSWDFANKTITSMSNSDFAKPLPKLGPQANEGDVVYILVADAHEHLGQLIAYARQNGIVPPWTVQIDKKKGNG